MNNNILKLPSLRGKIGDWYYYVTLMTFKEVSRRVSMVPDIHKSEKLSKLIQREVSNRSVGIVEYLQSQDQRFFNSLILGIYGGRPKWHSFSISGTEMNDYSNDEHKEQLNFTETEQDYFDSSVGILVLSGEEEIFAIDGQHRTTAIQEIVSINDEYDDEEIATIFVAHKNDEQGLERTRRLFSTLNRYAKPVDKNEIIAIDEEDNGAIITRRIVEEFELFNGKIQFQKSRSINIRDTKSFTNIIVLYDFIVAILTDQKVFNVPVNGLKYKEFITRRQPENRLQEQQNYIQELFSNLFERIPALSSYNETGEINRASENSSLLFRPVGQNILYSVLKVAISKGKKEEAIEFFANQDFSLQNETWKKVFYDNETQSMKTTKERQKYAFQIILKKLNIRFNQTKKDKELFDNFDIDPNSL
jgi:DNA sulfur modification protein DndB